MAKLKFSDDTLKFDYNSEIFEVRFPTHLEHKEYEQRVTELMLGRSDTNVFDVQKDFLVGLGLPVETCEKMQQKALNDIVMYLVGQKKISK